MIPKKIHYCWFGRNPLPESALKCIESWRKFFPDYEIVEWNEDNFDVNSIPYTSQAYAARKYAFVSDYARFKILYDHGGVYFDTDVEVIKPMDSIIEKGPFMGFEIDSNTAKGICGAINPGVGFGTVKHQEFLSQLLDYYKGLRFDVNEGNKVTTIVTHTTNLFKDYGLSPEEGIQTVAGFTLYPKEYFNPFDDNTGRLKITHNTYTIHWYSKTWIDTSPLRVKFSRLLHRMFGTAIFSRLRKVTGLLRR
jgi:mannosyltransferase OCH1 and related enzymes